MRDPDAVDELERYRQVLRDHFAQLVQLGRDPTAGFGFGPDVDRYDTLLVQRAASADVDLPSRPWRTNGERIMADDLCRRAGVVEDRPLVP